MEIKVKLRTKQISGNRQSLYLDYYPAVRDSKTGKLTRREFLGRFVLPYCGSKFSMIGVKQYYLL